SRLPYCIVDVAPLVGRRLTELVVEPGDLLIGLEVLETRDADVPGYQVGPIRVVSVTNVGLVEVVVARDNHLRSVVDVSVKLVGELSCRDISADPIKMYADDVR